MLTMFVAPGNEVAGFSDQLSDLLLTKNHDLTLRKK
jgi:hypothetical protein